MPGTIAILTEGKFEDLELFYPKYRFEEAGYATEILTPDGKDRDGEYGYTAKADKKVADADPSRYVALHLPGGVANPDKLRTDKAAVEFVRRFWESGRPVFAICHGGWTLVEADVLDGCEMTSWWSIRKDCENAGARWRDEPVVVHERRLVTSRQPPDLPHYCREALDVLDAAGKTGAASSRAGKAQPEGPKAR